jgi:hypothetical protein
MSKKALSTEARQKYKAAKAMCKKCEENLVKNFRVYGEQIKLIYDEELWVEEYESFPEFCQEELPFGWSRAYQLMRAVSVKDCTRVQSEAQARELLGLSDMDQVAVMDLAEAHGDTTREGVRTAREELEAEVGDKTGEEREKSIAELVNQAEERAAAATPAPSPSKRRGGGGGGARGPRKPKDRKAEVDRLVDRALYFLRLARKSWMGLNDVADENDREWVEATNLLHSIQERSKNSTEVTSAA